MLSLMKPALRARTRSSLCWMTTIASLSLPTCSLMSARMFEDQRRGAVQRTGPPNRIQRVDYAPRMARRSREMTTSLFLVRSSSCRVN